MKCCRFAKDERMQDGSLHLCLLFSTFRHKLTIRCYSQVCRPDQKFGNGVSVFLTQMKNNVNIQMEQYMPNAHSV